MGPALPWRVLQIADSAFPTGGFAHSAGLEAAVHFGNAGTPAGLVAYLEAHVWNAGHGALPFVGAAHDDRSAVWSLDAHLDALLTNHVANAASRTQGRAFIATCERAFDEPELVPLASRARARQSPSHLAPVFGAALAVLGLPRADALAVFLYGALRGAVSAAIRLGVVGPLEAARLSSGFAPMLDRVLAACADLRPDDATCTAPVADILAATHDRLYARLFQS
jgi:urease accessory protein